MNKEHDKHNPELLKQIKAAVSTHGWNETVLAMRSIKPEPYVEGMVTAGGCTGTGRACNPDEYLACVDGQWRCILEVG